MTARGKHDAQHGDQTLSEADMRSIEQIEQEKQIAQLYIERMKATMPETSEFEGMWSAHIEPGPLILTIILTLID